ncbi:MAG: hypothetical protein GY853_13785 [PVC group bacterium]|nr:hypothetical protein [PVC group bacterium]
MKTCKNCTYWVSNKDEKMFYPETGDGRCHRNAPIVSNDDRHEWPPTMEMDWCGEYKKKLEE